MTRASSYRAHTLFHLLLIPSTFIILCFVLPPRFIFKLFHTLFELFRKENLKGKVVLITGASSGIGEQLANEYAARGANLAIVARREKQLNEVAAGARALGSPDVLPMCADVSKIEDCQRFVERTVEHFGRLDYLVNNAGITSFCFIQDVDDITKLAPIMDVNFWGNVYPTYYAIPHLRKTRGKIVVNSSSTAYFNPPGVSFYSASKAALLSFYDSIGAELAPEISITIATLGFIDSEMTRGKSISRQGKVHVDSTLAHTADQFPIMSSQACARAILDAAKRRERYVTEPRWYMPLFLIKYFCPELVEWFSNKLIGSNIRF